LKSLPELADKEFRARVEKLKDCGHDELHHFINYALEDGITSEELISAEIGVEIKRLEIQLRKIMEERLQIAHPSKPWHELRQYEDIFEVAFDIRAKNEKLHRGIYGQNYSSSSLLEFLTLDRLWHAFTKSELSGTFPTIWRILNLPEKQVTACAEKVLNVRNLWAHHHELKHHYDDFKREHRKLKIFLDDYERALAKGKK
jgi:hypothetical protein